MSLGPKEITYRKGFQQETTTSSKVITTNKLNTIKCQAKQSLTSGCATILGPTIPTKLTKNTSNLSHLKHIQP